VALAQPVQEFGTPPAKKSELFLDECQNFQFRFMGSTEGTANSLEPCEMCILELWLKVLKFAKINFSPF
jgi:hypothetical protein